MAKNILVIPDAHAKPGVSNRRFDWLGKFIADAKPNVVVDIGDSFDMESLSSYDRGKLNFEGRRYKADIEAGQDAFARVTHFANRTVGGRSIRRIKTFGNHEQRIDRICEDRPEFHGVFSMQDSLQHGWEGISFLRSFEYAGVSFAHYFVSGAMGRPIGGEYQAANLIKKSFTSCVMGHSHIFDYAIRTTARGKRICGVVAGCYLDPKQYEPYAGPAGNAMWWRGLVMLRNCEDGQFDLQQISVKALEREYGRK